MSLRSIAIISILILQFLLTGVVGTSAQVLHPEIEIGASGNGFVYQGDLSNTQLGNIKDTRYGFGIFGKYYISPVFSARANIYYGSLRGDDSEFDEEWREKRAYKFSSSLTELSLMMEADMLGRGKFRSYSYDGNHYNRWSIYLFAGAGLTFVDASRDWSRLDRVYFGKDATENIPQDSVGSSDKMVLVIPGGLGARYDLSKKISVFAEAGYRFTFTDNMDGFKHSVYSPKHDGYTVYSLGLSYRFNSAGRYR